MTERNLSLTTLSQRSVDASSQHKSMSQTACYNNICQTHQSDKDDSEWYLKSSKQSLHVTQVKRCINLLYSKFDSEESYEIIKFFTTEKKLKENNYSSDDSHEVFL